MTQDPYAAPSAKLQDASSDVAAGTMRRPALVWFTQAMLLFFCLAAAAGLLIGVGALISGRGSVSSWWAALALVLSALEIALPAWLFYGLTYRRRWAWHGGIVFAVLFVAFVLWSRIHPAAGPLTKVEIKPEEMLGAATAEVVITLLLFVYPFRMFFSPKVRAFLGVRPFRWRSTP